MCRSTQTSTLVAAVLCMTAWTYAASIPVSRSTTLTASGQTSGDEFNLSDTLSAFGPYDNSIGDAIVVSEGGTTRAQASQQSDVSPGEMIGFARGSAEAQVAEFDAIAAQAESGFEFVFDVVGQDETLSLLGAVESTFDAAARVTVIGGGGDPIFERFVNFGEQQQVAFEEEVNLAPGRYTLSAEAIVTGTPTPNDAAFDLLYAVSNPIPLPPALWAGTVGLALALAAAHRARRRG